MKRINFVVIITVIVGILGLSCHANAREKQINIQALLAKRVPILLEFGRGWCIPCKYMKPILEEMGKVYSGKAIVTTVDMDANKALVRDFKIRMMPTQVFLSPDGKEFFRNEGILERDGMVQVFSRMGLPAPALQGAEYVGTTLDYPGVNSWNHYSELFSIGFRPAVYGWRPAVRL